MNLSFKTILSFITVFIINLSVNAQVSHTHPKLDGHLIFKNGLIHMQAFFNQPPVVGKEAALTLVAKDPQTHTSVNLNEKINVNLWMPSMGHGSSPTVVTQAVDAQGVLIPGTYTVNKIFFIMSGDWEVWVTLTDAQGQTEKQNFKMKIAGSGHSGH